MSVARALKDAAQMSGVIAGTTALGYGGIKLVDKYRGKILNLEDDDRYGLRELLNE